MKLDYFSIGKLAEEMGCRRDDLIALSPGNDPFYVHMPSRKQAAEWFAELWAKFGWVSGSHPRRLHYNVISRDPPVMKPNGEPYLNLENDWKFFLTASLGARYLRLIPDNALVDRRNPTPIINARKAWPGPTVPYARVIGTSPDLIGLRDASVEPPTYLVTGFEAWQDCFVELWIEKSTQNDVLVPLAQRLGVNLVPGTGETSEILARQAVERAIDDGRPMRILYVSDFDPGGRSMPVALARKIQFWLEDASLDLDITLDPIVLTPDQCEAYRLPRTPLKETERRAAKFEQRFGAGATELDALEALYPGAFAQIIEKEVCRYIDTTLWSRVRAAERSVEETVNKVWSVVMAHYDVTEFHERLDEIQDQLAELESDADETWTAITNELEQSAPQFDPDDLPRPKPATPPPAPLFDSRRDYLDQLDHYHRWQGRGGAA